MTAPAALAEPMNGLAVRPCGVDAPSRSSRIEVATDLGALESAWRDLEGHGRASPYQGFDWVSAYVSALAEAEGFEPCAVVLRDETERPLLILPLAIRHGRAGRVASIIGGRQANFHLPLTAPDVSARIDGPVLRERLVEAGRRLHIDAFAFSNLPRAWRGEPNLLAEGGRPSPSNGYRLTLEPDGEATLARALSKDTRKKLRKKEKALAELGPVTYRVARAAADAEAMLLAFLAQKRDRFRELGIANPFEDAATQAFLRRACLAGLEQRRPAVEIHALYAGERIVAVFGAAVDRRRCSGMFISFDPEAARSSPGDLLLTHVVRAQCAAGRETFDLGVGEARYKSSLCEEVEELVDVILPVTWRGRAYAAASTQLLDAKRRMKQTPWAWTLVGLARRLRARVSA